MYMVFRSHVAIACVDFLEVSGTKRLRQECTHSAAAWGHARRTSSVAEHPAFASSDAAPKFYSMPPILQH
jgi:hypothetical protein